MSLKSKLPAANTSMLLGASITLIIFVVAGLMTALFSNRPQSGAEETAIEVETDTTSELVTSVLPAGPKYFATNFANLPGWDADDLSEIMIAWRRSCRSLLVRPLESAVGPVLTNSVAVEADRSAEIGGVGGTAADWAGICQVLAGLPENDGTAVRRLIVENMTPIAVFDGGEQHGLFTGYYEPVLKGARERTDEFTAPLYAPPPDRISIDLGNFDPALRGRSIVGKFADGEFEAYDTRGDIGEGSLDERADAIFWLASPLDAFIMHVQGSARIDLPDGTQTRAGFAAHNGHAYRSIGRWLIDQGEIERNAASWVGIQSWIDLNPDRLDALLAINPRYIFFTENLGEGPIGAAGVPLTPRRSLAVDPDVIPLGIPVWLNAAPVGGSGDQIQRLMMAQDVGAAIKGAVRGDFYWGSGDGAGRVAGQMSSRGVYFMLLPNNVAGRYEPAPEFVGAIQPGR